MQHAHIGLQTYQYRRAFGLREDRVSEVLLTAQTEDALVALGEPALKASLDTLGGATMFGLILQGREQWNICLLYTSRCV